MDDDGGKGKLYQTQSNKADGVTDAGLVAVTGSVESLPDPNQTTAVLDHKAERALVWKFDLRLLPVLAVMYLFNSLDKSNLGNAKTAGLEKSLSLKDNQYNIILSVFFVPYVLTAPFLGIIGKKYGPNRVLPLMMFSFGSFTLLAAAAHNFAGIMTIRWFLGMSESAFFPLVIYYQTMYARCPLPTLPLHLLHPLINIGFIVVVNLPAVWPFSMPPPISPLPSAASWPSAFSTFIQALWRTGDTSS